MSENDKKVWVESYWKILPGSTKKWIEGYWKHLPEKRHKTADEAKEIVKAILAGHLENEELEDAIEWLEVYGDKQYMAGQNSDYWPQA